MFFNSEEKRNILGARGDRYEFKGEIKHCVCRRFGAGNLCEIDLKLLLRVEGEGGDGFCIDTAIFSREVLQSKTRLKNTDVQGRLSYQRCGSASLVLPVASRSYERIFRSIIPLGYFLVIAHGDA